MLHLLANQRDRKADNNPVVIPIISSLLLLLGSDETRREPSLST